MMFAITLRWLISTAFCRIVSQEVSINTTNTHGKTRSSAGIAQVGNLSRTLTLDPVQRLELRSILAFSDQVVDSLERSLGLEARNWEEKDAVLGDTGALGRDKGIVEKRDAGEEGVCAGRDELVLKLLGRVCGAGGGDDAGETVNGVGQGNVVNLCDAFS